MKYWSVGRMQLAIVMAVLLLAPRIAGACSVCFGDPGSPSTRGLTAAVLFLVAIIVAVLVGVAVFAVSMLRRSAQQREQGNRSTTVAEGTHG